MGGLGLQFDSIFQLIFSLLFMVVVVTAISIVFSIIAIPFSALGKFAQQVKRVLFSWLYFRPPDSSGGCFFYRYSFLT